MAYTFSTIVSLRCIVLLKFFIFFFQLSILGGRQTELSVFGQVAINSFLYQGKLKAPTETRDYMVVSQADPYIKPAIV